MAERDRLFKRHPKTKFVAAHLGWHGSDLGRVGKMFDAMPNLYAELGAVLYDLGRQPRVAHDFLLSTDRILFGKDSSEPSRIPVLLARPRDEGRLLRLLPRVSRVLEAVRTRLARRGTEKHLLSQRASHYPGAAANRVA